MNKLAALLALFRAGSEVANAAAWTNRTIVLNLLVALAGVAAAFGYHLQLDDATLAALAGGIVAAVGVGNSIVHVATDARVGLQPRDSPNASTGSAPGARGAGEEQPDIRDPGGA